MILVDRGTLQYEANVSKYWPEFAKNGKENITISDLLAEKSGIEIPFSELNVQITYGRSRFVEFLEKQKPNPYVERKYGTLESEKLRIINSIFYGSELIIRSDFRGRNPSKFFAEEIGKPFGISISNNPRELSNASSLAKLFGSLAYDVKMEGKPLLSHSEIVRKAIQYNFSNKNKILSVGGFVILSEQNPNAFNGSESTIGYADLERNLGLSYISNDTELKLNQQRQSQLIHKIYQCMDENHSIEL